MSVLFKLKSSRISHILRHYYSFKVTTLMSLYSVKSSDFICFVSLFSLKQISFLYSANNFPHSLTVICDYCVSIEFVL